MRRRKGSSTPPRLLGDILPETLRKKSLHIPVRDRALADTWNRAVGPQIAAKAQPDRIKDDILYVRVVNSVWMHELQFMKQDIMAKLNEVPGAARIGQIRFFIGEVEAPQPKPASQERPIDPRDLKSDEKDFIDGTLTGVNDPELKDILQRAMARSILRGRKGP
jgi:predicted nucleic acid-binding Zn ribbon protein